MSTDQLAIAEDIITCLEQFSFTKKCSIHGSLLKGNSDRYSDIDLQLDVSGSDNGKILLMLPYLINRKFPLAYTAFAPRFAPDLYVVSVALIDSNIFHFIDIECVADPHIQSLSKEEIIVITDYSALKTKLLIGCLKIFLRGTDFRNEIQFLLNDTSDSDPLTLLKDAFLKQKEDTTGELQQINKKCLGYLE